MGWGGGSQAKGLQYFIEGGSGQMITILHRGDRGGGVGGKITHLLHFLINLQNAVLGGSVQMITIFHRGGSGQMITVLHGGGVCPNDYNIT